jgi:putative MATE family efflux protein
VYTCAGVYFAGDFLILIGTPQEIAESSGVYLAILLGFCGFQAIRLVGSSILRATGDTRTPMWATAVMNVFNILANWVLIYGIGPFPRMEVAGVALASGLSYVISACIVMWKLTRKNPVFFITRSDMTQIARDILHTILRIAGPNMAEMVLMRAGGLTYIWIVTSLGTVSLAAHYMAIRVESFAFMPAFGLAMAVPPLVGQALGAGKPEMAILAVRRTVKAGVYGMIVLGFLFILVPGVFVRIFSPEPDVYFIASIVVQISALELIGVTLNMIYGGAMRGAGDTVSPMIVTFIGAIIIRISLVYWMTILLGWGLSGVWIATAIDWTLRAIVGWILFRRGRWQNIKV